jgi:hypothetical protein
MQMIGVDAAYTEQCAQFSGCAGLGSFGQWNAPGNAFLLGGLDTGYVYIVVVCIGDPNTGVCPPESPSAVATLFRSEVTLSDTSAPQAISASGPLVQPGPHHGVESASLNMTDRGSGVYRSTVEVDGVAVDDRVVDDNGGKCADAVPGNSDPFEFLDKQPCKLNATAAVSVDTTTLPDGDHTLQMSAIDAAGNATRMYGPAVFRVDNHSVGTVPNGTNASDTARLVLSLPARVRRGQAIPFNARTTIRGRLVNGEGQGIGNAELEAVTRNASPGARRVIERLRTNPDGTFAITFPQGRPSRTVRFVYRARLRDPREAAAAAVTMRVRAGVRMTVSPRRVRNRQSVMFSGRLLGRSIPARGKLIEVQVRFPTGWRTFATVRTRRSGGFRYRYRFLRSFDPVTYRFRVRARSERSFPYETGVSRVVSVRVR